MGYAEKNNKRSRWYKRHKAQQVREVVSDAAIPKPVEKPPEKKLSKWQRFWKAFLKVR